MSSVGRHGSDTKYEYDLFQLLPELDQLLAQDPFDAHFYVERLAWCMRGSQDDHETFDPSVLHKAFGNAIQHLQAYYESTEQRCECLEMICREEEKRHWKKTDELLAKNKAAFETFKELDERIDFVATKVVYLGDHLESVNIPRARAVEAQKLIQHFSVFMEKETEANGILQDKSKLHEAADVIQKLYLISQELPSGRPVFDKARQRIAKKYDSIERDLIEEFVQAHQVDDKIKMRDVATILSHFKGYSQCVDAFIEQSQLGMNMGRNMFISIVPICATVQATVTEVFTNPEQVMSKFVLNVYHEKLMQHVQNELRESKDPEQYLMKLFELYTKTTKLSHNLLQFKLGNDSTFLSKLTKNIFARYLDDYIHKEKAWLKDRFDHILNTYYDSRNHQKKHLHFGGINELYRDIQAKIGARANIVGSSDNSSGGETLLSEEVAMNLLQESKTAFKRCQTLSRQSDLANNAMQLFDLLLNSMYVEHITYALDLGLLAIPLPEPKTAPETNFFDIVRQCNAIYHLFEKQFVDIVVPLVISTPKHSECLKKKKRAIDEMESKLDTGLERCVTAMAGWVKYLLQSEQKKTDFKPEGDMNAFDQADKATVACTSVVKFLLESIKKIKNTIDGKNVEAVLTTLGVRVHKVILDHLLQFQYSSIGAMALICDLNEYRRCMREFNIPLLDTLFETLHALCNLLVVDPANLKMMCSSDQLSEIDRSVLMNFVQLRSDYKTAKLVNQFR